jgi:flagellar basal-body rod protein FlgF
MENTLLIGLSRQMALHRELDVVANNVANMNTTGYKADAAVFEEFLMPGARANQFAATDSRLSFVQDRTTWHDLSPGVVQQTGNPLDIAIDGNAFLVVQTPRGERYTRNGALQINATGELVTSDGYRVVGQTGPIVFQNRDREITIAAEGTITVREGNNTKQDSQRGKLRLVSFDQGQQLKKDGSNLFIAPANAQPQAAAQGTRVIQGALEKSNVRSMVEMTRMIEITRTYTQVSQILQQQSDLRRTAIERLAEVPA